MSTFIFDKYGMHYRDILEGRAHTVTLRYLGNTEEILVIQNPTVSQSATLIERARQEDGSFYLRGFCYEGRSLYVGNGWKLTHDDLLYEFMPKIESHDSGLTTFEISNRGGDVVRQGDYDVLANRYYKNLIAAINT